MPDVGRQSQTGLKSLSTNYSEIKTKLDALELQLAALKESQKAILDSHEDIKKTVDSIINN